jgi:small conductance mechanosensitive channel
MQLLPSLESFLVFLGSVAATLAAGYVFSLIVRRSLRRYNPLLAEIIARYGSWTIYLAGFLFSLELLNLKLETILVFVALLGVLIALGLRDVLPNYFARQFIEMYRPFSIGDWIQVGDLVGRVVEVNDLYTQLVTHSHQRVYIPNSVIVRSIVSNLSRSSGVDVSVSFSLPLHENLEELLRRVRRAIADDAKEEGVGEPELRITELKENSVGVEVRVRVLNPQRVEEVRSRVLREVYKVVRSSSRG